MTLAEPTFPPLLDGRLVVKGDDPRLLAINGAASGELGAGDTLWLQDTAQAELAIVLEPDDPLTKAAQMLPLAIAAAGDCLAALTPPQVAVQFRWPGILLLNGASVGQCTLTVPAATKSTDIPGWMVLGFSLRLAFDATAEPGTTPGITSLVEEGGEELTTSDVLESFSRHFLSLLDTWNNDGFIDVCENWSTRAEGKDEAVDIPHPTGSIKARVLSLDEDGNLIVRPNGSDHSVALSLVDCIVPSAPAATTSSANS